MSLKSFTLQMIDTCFNDGSCDFVNEGFKIFMEPLEWTLGPFAPVAIWGFLIGIIWIRTQSVQLVGLVGIVLNTMLVSFYEPAREIGFVLLGISVGISIYQLITNRINHGSNT